MAKPRFSLAYKDEALQALMAEADHRNLAVWAVACAEHVLWYFEDAYPQDARPRNALEVCRKWIETGVFRMADIRGASLAAHAAAREVGEDNAARSAARAAGQAVATAHVVTHAIGAPNYALQAIYRAASPADVASAIAAERAWQYQRLLELIQS